MEVAHGSASNVQGGLDLLADIFSTPAPPQPPSSTSPLEPVGMYACTHFAVLLCCMTLRIQFRPAF